MKFAAVIVASMFAVAFYVFTYNSGYGYDALEYLIIGRSLLDGYSVFAMSPSKSPGIFYVTTAFLKFFPNAGHLEISVLITALLLVILAATYIVVRASHGTTVAFIASALLALCACFMEMNFLETEGFVFLIALPALPFLRNGLRTGAAPWFALAGLFIGAAAFFKSVALFYLLGATLFIILWIRQHAGGFRFLPPVIALWIGAATAVGIPVLFYLIRGEGASYLFWTYIFPLLHYERDTLYASKLLLKLGWFWALLVLSLLLSLHPRVRSAFSMSVYPAASLALGLSALLVLSKNQASHYVFPAAGFLCIFMAMTWTAFAETHRRGRRILMTVALVGGVLAASSLALYRPSAIRRLFTVRDYSHETELARQLQMLVPENQTILCMSHPLPYWLAHRYPAIPVLATHAHFAHLLRQNPRLLLDALDDPRLALVEFDPGWTQFRAPVLKNDPVAQRQLQEFSEALTQRFRTIEIENSPYRFWVRK